MTDAFNLTLSMVASLDGRTTSPDGPVWSSPEDQIAFESLRDSKQAVIIGRITAEEHTLKKSASGTPLRIVMTRNPNQFSKRAKPGSLEFTDESPDTLVRRLRMQGITDALLAGGSTINSLFIEAGLITEAYFTYEPIFLGEGNGIFKHPVRNAAFRLIDSEKLNASGTIRLRYTISYER